MFCPAKFPSVQGLKIYDHDFEQTRELTFALSRPQDVDKLENSRRVFAERLGAGKHGARACLAGSPMPLRKGIRDLQCDRGPVASQPEPSAFDEAMSNPATGESSRSPSSLARADRSGLAAAAVRKSFRSIRSMIAPALNFAQSTADRTRTTAHLTDRTMRIFL